MFRAPRFVCLAGSCREGSHNMKLAAISARILKAKGAEVQLLNLKDYDLPLFNEDDEKKEVPAGLSKLKEVVNRADGFVIASPEYNGCLTPLLVNALAWLSRPGNNKDEPMYFSFKRKVAMVAAASPGGLGGLRGLVHARQLLTNMGTTVIPEQIAVGAAYKAFGEDSEGNPVLTDERQSQLLDEALQALYELGRGNANKEATCKMVHKFANEYGDIILP
eukprot:Sspe_Gene.79780::Locus_50101_Transcript_1_1_Confidence_1.000_Length_741::g.79780::m.79780